MAENIMKKDDIRGTVLEGGAMCQTNNGNGQKATLVVDVCDIMALSLFFTTHEDEVKEDGLEPFADRIHRLANAYENDSRKAEMASKG